MHRFCSLCFVFVVQIVGWQVASFQVPASGQELQPDFGISATFSIVAVDPETGECGAAVASKYPAVGKVVPYVRAGVGAFCTQHWHNPDWGERALDLLEAGNGSEQVLATLLADDPRRDKRQLAIIDMQGRAANRNPVAADPSGYYWGAISGRYYACQGNTLVGREVIVAMAEAFEESSGSLTDRLMAALVAGDCVGGDHRGRLAAGIRVAKVGQPGQWFALDVDESDDAVRDLLDAYLAIDHEAKGDWTQSRAWVHPCPAEENPAAEAVAAAEASQSGAADQAAGELAAGELALEPPASDISDPLPAACWLRLGEPATDCRVPRLFRWRRIGCGVR